MSKFSFRPRGGMQGIEVTDEELLAFADKMESHALDSVIPLPDVDADEQIKRIEGCEHKETEYYERLNGRHGWCCEYCGTVVQWG